MPHPVNDRFIQVFEYLKDRGRVASQKEFARVIGFPDTHFTGYKSGERNIQLFQITNLYIIFGVSPLYILLGDGAIMEDAEKEKKREQENPVLSQRLAVEKARNELLEARLKEARKEIAYYRKLIEKRLKNRD